MNKTAFLQHLAGCLFTLRGDLKVDMGQQIWLSQVYGDTQPLYKWLEEIAFKRRYLVWAAEYNLVADTHTGDVRSVWDCKGVMVYHVRLDEGDIVINIASVQKRLDSSAVKIQATI